MQEQATYWYVARTRHGSELRTRDRLSQLGVESFVPSQMRISSNGKKKIEEPLLCSFVFLRSTKDAALELIHAKGVKADYCFDCATHRMMIVPDKQMDDFRRVLDDSVDVGGLLGQTLLTGDKVRVTKGALQGVEGRVIQISGKTYVVVGLLDCIFARARVPRAWLELI